MAVVGEMERKMSIWAFIFYIGGVWCAPNEWGFWKTMVWPFFLGKLCVNKINDEGL